MGNVPASMQRAMETLRRAVARAWDEALGAHAANIDAAALAEAIEERDIARAVALMSITAAALGPFSEAIRNAVATGGNGVMGAMPRMEDPRTRSRVRPIMDTRTARIERYIAGRERHFIQQVSRDVQEAAQLIITGSMHNDRGVTSLAVDLVGRTNRETGLREGGLIKLTSEMSAYVENAREELETVRGMSAYKNRKLRDRRYDGAVNRAIRDGTPLSTAKISEIARAYARRQALYRGAMIARTEALTAYRSGRHEAIKQLTENGLAKPEEIIRTWVTSGTDRTRDQHAAMDGEEVEGIDTPWTMPDGSQMMFPGDTSLGAGGEQTIHCMCVETIRIVR